MRRTCVINPTLGEGPILRDGQFCGGHIDPLTLNATTYVPQAGSPGSPEPKGYICPLGQICMVRLLGFGFVFLRIILDRNYQIPRTVLKHSMGFISHFSKLLLWPLRTGYVGVKIEVDGYTHDS